MPAVVVPRHVLTRRDLSQEPICPQPGRQTQYLECRADGCLYGGAAYSGKSYALLMESARNAHDPNYGGIIFRRKTTEILTPGGLWDTAGEVYSATNIRAEMKSHLLTAVFPSGGKVKLTHLEHEKHKLDHKGGAYPFLGFDELTSFSKTQFMYLLTRNRPGPGCRIPPYWRATTNPDADSWVRVLVDWWIGPDGYPIPERVGVWRWYTVIDNDIVWVDQNYRDENGIGPKSFTFIAATIDDNPLGEDRDPTYRATLTAQDRVTREQLLKGNWNISYKGGMFDPRWFEVVDALPAGIRQMRYWDFAATPEDEEEQADPDWSSGARGGIHDGVFYITDVRRKRDTPAGIEAIMKDAATADGPSVAVGWEEEKGSAGRYLSTHIMRDVLPDRVTYPDRVEGSKVERAKPWAAKAERGLVKLLQGPWNDDFLRECGSFPLKKKDQVDSVSGLYKMLTTTKTVFPSFDITSMRKERTIRPFTVQWHRLGEHTSVFVSQWVEANLRSSLLLALYNADKRALYVALEMTFDDLGVANIVVGMTKLVRALTEGKVTTLNKYQWLASPIVGSLPGANDLRAAFGRYRINPLVQSDYDELGAIGHLGRLLDRRRLVIHERCAELSRQLSGWPVVDEKFPQKDEYGLARALCLIVGVLWEQGVLEEKEKIYDSYTPEHTARLRHIDEKARQGRHHDVVAEDIGAYLGPAPGEVGGWMT